MGYDTGIDIKKVAGISKEMEQFLGHSLPGQLYDLVDKTDIKRI